MSRAPEHPDDIGWGYGDWRAAHPDWWATMDGRVVLIAEMGIDHVTAVLDDLGDALADVAPATLAALQRRAADAAADRPGPATHTDDRT